jgi:hypothetical protein
MKTFGFYFVSALLIGISSMPAHAEENESPGASFSLQFTGLRWDQSRTKYSDESKAWDSIHLKTGDLVDAVVWATIGRLNVYFYPFLDSNALVSVGYMLREDLEIGFDLGVNATRIEEPKTEMSSDLMGAFITWSLPFEYHILENYAVFDFTRGETTNVDTSTQEEETRKQSGSYFKVSSTVIVPLAKNVWYMTGLWWAAENGKDHTTRVTKKSSQFGLTVAGLRLTVD